MAKAGRGGAAERAVQALELGVDIADARVAGRHGDIPIRRYRPASAEPSATFVWLHGGGFMHGGLDQRESHAVSAALAQRGFEVVAVDYRLVPGGIYFRDPPPSPRPGVRFPVPLEDVVDAYTAAADAGPAFLGGASAGACLAAAATLRLAAEGKPVPPGLVLVYGNFHAELPPLPDEIRARVRGLHGWMQFRPRMVRRMHRNYVATDAALADPHAFPGGHDLSGLPPSLLIDADRDTLRSSAQRFARELAEADVPVERHVVRDSTHGFLNKPATPHFVEGTELIGAWLARQSATLGGA